MIRPGASLSVQFKEDSGTLYTGIDHVQLSHFGCAQIDLNRQGMNAMRHRADTAKSTPGPLEL